MLPAFIIEQLRKREEAKKEAWQQPQLELPIPFLPNPKAEQQPKEDEERGVLVIELF